MSVNSLVTQIKENNEDFEWYPTTQEIVDCIAKDLSQREGESVQSILDVGCGNGSFFKKLDSTGYFYKDDWKSPNYNSKLHKHYKKYGIEKSNILAEQLPEDVVLLGSDFYTNNLIDKKVDVLFCNPPYSDYDGWTEKIIYTSNCKDMYLVIPERWKNSERIKFAIERRRYESEVIGTFNFSNAERKARATVDIVHIKAKGVMYQNRRYNGDTTDPFDTWFEDTFKFNAEKSNDISDYKKEETKKNEIISKGDTVEMLVKFYNEDMEKLYNNYRALEKLDPEIFEELKVDVNMLKESLKSRLQGLKHLYWDLLFKKYDKLTSRLTTKGVQKVTQRLQDNTAIDFTVENIFQLTMWIIRHSNTLFDEQLTDFFYSLCNTENIHRYKSNLRWNDDDWRYLKKDCFWEDGRAKKDMTSRLKNIQLDYRIIVTSWRNFDFDWSRTRLTDSCMEFLNDLSVIAHNLGFEVDMGLPKDKWTDIDYTDWQKRDVYTKDGKLFCNLKLYKNGNRHIKFCKEFMQKLNVEMARINGWIHDKSDVMEEMELTAEEVNRIWNSNKHIAIGETTKLLGLPDIA